MSPHPKCPVCKHSHAMGQPHIWDDELPARSSVVEPGAHNALVAGSIPAAPTKLTFQGVEIILDTPDQISGVTNHRGERILEASRQALAALLVKEMAEKPGLKISPAAEALIESRLAEDVILKTAMDKSFPKPLFDRAKYQRDYMRDRTKAKALGLTVKEWRDKFGGKDD